MENPIWNLILKVSSGLAAALLVLGTVLVAASFFGFTQNGGAGVATVVFASFLAVFSLVAVNFSHARLKREILTASEVAHRLSQGELYSGPATTELLESLGSISTYLTEKSAISDSIAAGDFAQVVAPRSDADRLGISLRSMTENLQHQVQTRESRDRLQMAVMKLLEEVSEVAAGDLTVQAETGPEVTGAIADAFNSMTRNLRSLIKQVKDVTMQVGSSASAISETTEQLARGSEAQASQIARTTSSISTMAQQVQEVSENADLAAKVANESLSNARSGTKAAHDNINAMNCVRKQVQETAKRIKRLGERSQEISQIVALIEDLSDRTSLLALNASLQASTPGKADNSFAVVVEEVERLAERSNRLTHQISTLTQAINVETKEVVSSMEETIHEVIVGSTRAEKAGQSLFEIERISSKLAELLKSISESARYQARSSEDISNAMSGISDVTELVQLGSKRAAESVRTLVQLSGDLRSSVSPFKLPTELDPSRSGAQDTGYFVN